MMYKPVNQCRCQAVIPEDLIPATKLQVRGGDDALPLIAVRDDGKEQFSRLALEGDVWSRSMAPYHVSGAGFHAPLPKPDVRFDASGFPQG